MPSDPSPSRQGVERPASPLNQPAINPAEAADAADTFSETPKPRSLRALFSWRSLWRAALLAALCWVVTVVLITTVQRRLVFVGQSVFRNVDLSVAATGWNERQLRDVQVTTEDGLTLNGWLALTEPSSLDDAAACKGQPLAIYFGGNAGTRRMRLSSLKMLGELGCNTLIVDYRSFADNPGSPSETNFLADARRIADYARDTLGVPADRTLIYGESLGGAVATGLAAALCDDGLTPAGLVLRATFASMTETAGHHYPFLPVGLLLIDRFESDERIAHVTCPILQFHGDEDVVIPLSHGRRLFGEAPDKSDSGIPKRFELLPGAGHNNLMRVASDKVFFLTADWFKQIGLIDAEASAARGQGPGDREQGSGVTSRP